MQGIAQSFSKGRRAGLSSSKLTESTRQAIDDYLKATGKKPGEYLFTGRRGPSCTHSQRFAEI
jgi:hypothetical protein